LKVEIKLLITAVAIVKLSSPLPSTPFALVLILIFLFDFCLHCHGNDCKSKGQTKIKGQIRIKKKAREARRGNNISWHSFNDI